MVNLKVRFKNPVFIVQLLLSIFVPVLGYYGLTAQDFTTWESIFEVVFKAIQNPYVVGTMVVGLWNALNDPTTKGLIADSERAKTYKKPQ